MEEQTLVEHLKHGDMRAFQQLVQEYQHKVVNTCYGFVHNQEDGEEIAQEVFLEVYQSIQGFRGEAKLSSWMYRIAVSKSLDFLRKQRRKKRFAIIQSFLGFETPVTAIPPSLQGNPQSTLENQERAQVLQQAIDTLPENQRIALTLNRYEGLSYQEITEVMDTSLSAVESLLHRAKRNLRKKLQQYYAQAVS